MPPAGSTAAGKYGASLLSPDILVSICTHLNPRDRVALSAACRHFRKVVTSDDCWRSLLSPNLADHAEPLHDQAHRIGSASRTAPFRRRSDGAAITFVRAAKVCHPNLRSRAGDLRSDECIRVAVPPGNKSVAHLPQDSDANQYWVRFSSNEAPGQSVLKLRRVCWLSVVSELGSLPKGDHYVAFNFRVSTRRGLLSMPTFKLLCEVIDGSGHVRKSFVLDTGDGTSGFHITQLALHAVHLHEAASAPEFTMWTRVEIDVSLEAGDIVLMSVVNTTNDWKTGLELGCCEAVICSQKQFQTEWRAFTTADGGRTYDFVRSNR